MDWFSALLGGLVGGVLGVIGSVFAAYWGPRWLEEWRENKKEEMNFGPRKKILQQMLEDTKFESRKLETLCFYTGTTKEECRRLLIEIGARGVKLEHGEEGWALSETVKRRSLNTSRYTRAHFGGHGKPDSLTCMLACQQQASSKHV